MTIVNLAEHKAKKQAENADTVEAVKPEQASEEDFKAIEERNRRTKEKVEKQRQQDNKSVKRSYRLEPKKGK